MFKWYNTSKDINRLDSIVEYITEHFIKNSIDKYNKVQISYLKCLLKDLLTKGVRREKNDSEDLYNLKYCDNDSSLISFEKELVNQIQINNNANYDILKILFRKPYN